MCDSAHRRRVDVHGTPGHADCRRSLETTAALIPVQGLLEVFGYFRLVLIGVELLETLKAYVGKDAIHVRVVLVVAMLAMARKVIIEESNTLSSFTLFGIAALILALGVGFYFEHQSPGKTLHSNSFGSEK